MDTLDGDIYKTKRDYYSHNELPPLEILLVPKKFYVLFLPVVETLVLLDVVQQQSWSFYWHSGILELILIYFAGIWPSWTDCIECTTPHLILLSKFRLQGAGISMELYYRWREANEDRNDIFMNNNCNWHTDKERLKWKLSITLSRKLSNTTTIK